MTLWIALLACDDRPPCEIASSVDATLEASAPGDFVALTDGDSLTREFGQQGGSHVFVTLRATGVDPGSGGLFGDGSPGPVTTVWLEQGGATIATSGADNQAWDGDPEEADLDEVQVFFGYTYGSTYGSADPTGDVHLRASVEDSCGTTLDLDRIVVID